MKLIARTTIRKESGEYHVRAYDENGKRMPDSDYFTDDKTDAQDTARAMFESYVKVLSARVRLATDSFKNALEEAQHLHFSDVEGFNVDVRLFAQDAAHHARRLLDAISFTDALLRSDVLSNDELIELYNDTWTILRPLFADAIRTRVERGIIKPDAGDRYYDGAPDYRCGHCGIRGGH